MNYRVNAALAVGRRRLFESLIHPGFYVALAAGLAIAYFFTNGFVRAIDSSGFDYALDPLYNLTGGILKGAFGSGFVSRVFADGPFLLTLHIAFVPVLLYLAMTSIYRFGTEKSSGAIELLCYGPSDGTSYFLASLFKDVVLTAVALISLLAFFAVAGLIDNLAITRPFLVSFALLFVTSLTVYAYGVLVSVISDNANTALAIFVAGFLVFLVSLIGSQAITSGYARSLSTVAGWLIRWFSPFFYWSLSTKGQMNGEAWLFLIGLFGQLLLMTTLVLASHFIVKARGVRP